MSVYVVLGFFFAIGDEFLFSFQWKSELFQVSFVALLFVVIMFS